jgi:hypothetical protein
MLFLAAAAFVDLACLEGVGVGSGCQAPSCGRIEPDVVERGAERARLAKAGGERYLAQCAVAVA